MANEEDPKKAAKACFDSIELDPELYRIGHTKARKNSLCDNPYLSYRLLNGIQMFVSNLSTVQSYFISSYEFHMQSTLNLNLDMKSNQIQYFLEPNLVKFFLHFYKSKSIFESLSCIMSLVTLFLLLVQCKMKKILRKPLESVWNPSHLTQKCTV
jgi:hypothetical protein